MSEVQFQGFTRETIQFFEGIEQNNNKEWFEQNRKIYEQNVRDKFRELVVALSPAMKSIDVDFDLRPHRCISRINRDIRFSKNKNPYKTQIWMSFSRAVVGDEWLNYPGYFMELNARQYVYGMGYFHPKRTVMDDVRDHISYRAEEFQQMTQQTVFDRGFEVKGEEYKRPIANELSDYFQPWIQRKGVFVIKECPIGEEVFTEEFQKIIQEDFLALEWLYNFFKESQPE